MCAVPCHAKSEEAEVIIDSHVHLKHGDSARTEYAPETIVEVMDAVGIDRSVVFAMSTTTRHSIEMAAEACERGFLEKRQMEALTLDSRERLSQCGFAVGDSKPHHIIVRPPRRTVLSLATVA